MEKDCERDFTEAKKKKKSKKRKRKTQDFSVFRETEAVNEAERVRCADRFLSSLKKSRALDFCTPSFVF